MTEDFTITLESYDGTDADVVVPDGITKVGRRAFTNNRYLRSVTLPEGVLEIDDEAFSACVNLVSVNIPQSVRRIGAGSGEGSVQ